MKSWFTVVIGLAEVKSRREMREPVTMMSPAAAAGAVGCGLRSPFASPGEAGWAGGGAGGGASCAAAVPLHVPMTSAATAHDVLRNIRLSLCRDRRVRSLCFARRVCAGTPRPPSTPITATKHARRA